ncbi:GntR family transcriptional regulator [Burkholderia sp. SRS-W-2-2016]|uniref:GntR family transcriptional regulator n=1 Tax=Burkholderia sp. SRS-W-2-2016 TaxID=1926878 RepID=UPI00094B17B7|nr:GntR family transcriptional regulator [Burkholderia sp. SRS-W-2-2016]OLL31684.1 GntR family transcriptional regulator [Burkholderia sp. SRS-W-2-2016]
MPLPKYHQIYLVLRQQLDEGLYVDGVPPEVELAQRFGVGRVTVRRALEQLVNEGLIIREAGRGTWPAPRSEQQEAAAQGDHPNLRLGGLLNNIVQASRKTSIKVLEWSVIHASPALAQALQIAEGASVRKIVRVRSTNAGPVSFITSYLPVERATGFTRADVARRPVLELLEESGVEWGRARQTISASQADATVATELDVSIGAALLSVRRLVYDSNDQPVQLLHGLYRPDRYEYQMELTRLGDIDARVVESEISP